MASYWWETTSFQIIFVKAFVKCHQKIVPHKTKIHPIVPYLLSDKKQTYSQISRDFDKVARVCRLLHWKLLL